MNIKIKNLIIKFIFFFFEYDYEHIHKHLYTNTDVDKQKHETLNSLLNFKYLLDSVLNIITLLLLLFY